MSLSDGTRSGTARRVVVITLAVEAAVVAGYGVYLGLATLLEAATEVWAAVTMSAMAVLTGLALALLARAVSRGRQGARVPVLLWQVLQASIAVPALTTSRWPVGLALLVACVLAGAGVMRGDVLDPVEGRES